MFSEHAVAHSGSGVGEAIDAIGCTYDALANDMRRIVAENGEIIHTNKSAISH